MSNIPNLDDLPDLSDWRYVEVLTIEEAALLWGAIDPVMYPGIEEAKGNVPDACYRRAFVARRAFSEAVCIGTLGFVEAWEYRPIGWNQEDIPFKVDFPDLPQILQLIPRMTRVKSAALLSWSKGKFPTIRQESRARIPEKPASNQPAQHEQPASTVLSLPGYSTPSIELLKVHVEENLAGVPQDQRPTPEEQREWIEEQGTRMGLGKREREAIYYVARPEEVKIRAAGKGVHPKTK